MGSMGSSPIRYISKLIKNMREPEHHNRYRKAWEEYSTCFDKVRAKELEREMDSAQNHFGWDEFQEFKKTLPGYIEYWNFLFLKGAKMIETHKEGESVNGNILGEAKIPKCIYCGNDIRSEDNYTSNIVEPDSHRSIETWEYYHNHCKEMQKSIQECHKYIMTCDPEQRLDILGTLFAGVCRYCGFAKQGVCHCQNDE